MNRWISGQNKHAYTRTVKAFTFLEIMFVVVIIGILLSIVGPKMAGRGRIARIAACKAMIRNLQIGLESFELDIGEFPDESVGLKALFEAPSDIDENSWNGPYMKETL